MSDYDASIRVSTKVDTSQMQKLQIQIDKATQKVSALSVKCDELKNKKVPTTQYAELEKKLSEAQKELEKLIADEQRLVDIGLDIGAPYDNIIAKEAEVQLRIEEITAAMQKLTEAGRDFKLGGDQDEIAKVTNELSMAEAQLRALTTRQNELNTKQVGTHGNVKKISSGFKALASIAGKAFKAITGGTKTSNGLFSTMASRLKSLALSLLVFNWVSKGFNAMVSYMKEGFENLAKYSDDFNGTMSEFKSQLATLKNSLATAFAPIASIILPYLTQFISWINTACDSIARFLAALSGKTTYTKAKKQMVDYAGSIDTAKDSTEGYADSIDMAKDSAEEAKEAFGNLAGFDKLNVIGNQDKQQSPQSPGGSSPGSGGGAGGNGGEGGLQFEEVEIGELSDFLQRLKDAIENGDWFGAGAILGEKLNEVLSNIDWGAIQNKAKNIAENIANFLNGFIAATDWNLVGATLSEGLNTALIFVYTLITTFDWKEAGQAVADTINGLFSTVDWSLLGTTISEGLKGLLEFARTAIQGTDWESIGSDIAEILKNIDWIGLLEEVGGLMIDAIVAGFQLLNGFVDAILGNEDAFELIAVAIGGITAAIIAYNIQQSLAAAGTTLWAAICGIATPATTALGAAFAFLTSPIGLVIIAITAIIAIVVLLVKHWDKVKEVALNVWQKIKSVWASFASWFSKNVWEPFKKGLKTLGNFFIDIWNGIVSAFESAINWIIKGINKALEAVNEFIGGATGLLEHIGINVSFQIPTISEVSFGRIPKLANGAVIRGGQPFLAMLGDQPAGQTNIEAPLSTIKQALKEALRESGGTGGEYTFVAQLNGRTLYKETVRQDQMHRITTGKSSFA